jgi:small subunit ribosomal protein S4
MKRSRKKYERPRSPWDKERIEKERELLKGFGLRTKKEIWKTEAMARKYRRMARELAASRDKEKEKILLTKLKRMGLLGEDAVLDDVLALRVEDFLERRLQTLIQRKGLANSFKQARQLIVHGHVKVGGRKIVYPGYMVLRSEEDKIEVSLGFQKPKVVVSGE